MYAVEMRGITKRFPGMIANDQIEFLVEKGEIHSLLGENGAGKTTLMKILFGLYQPDGGSIKINGNEIKHQTAVKAFEMGLGMVHQHFMLIDNMTVWENIVLGSEPGNFMIDRKKGKEIVKHLSEKYHFDLDVDAKISEISVGMKQRVEILKTLYRGAEIIILDEPTAGMDTTTRQRFWEIINDLKKSGVTILYSSHYIEEVEHTADRILVLHQGKLIRDTTPHAMRSEEKEKQVTLSSRFAPSLDKLADIYDVTEKRDVVTFMTKDIESVWSSLQAHGCRISDIEIQNKTLLDSLFDSTREDKS